MPSRAERADRHGWNSFTGFFNAHDRRIADLCDEGFVIEDGLSKAWMDANTFVVEGRLRCQHGLFVDVRKYLEVQSLPARIQVRTYKYRYHAGIEGSTDRPIFRYDNADTKPGHGDAHHKHRFDPMTWQEMTPPLWVGEEGWPHLSDVIEELQGWWETIGRFLDLADRG